MSPSGAVLAENGPDSFIWWEWIDNHRDDIREATVEHLQLTFGPVAAGFAIAMVLAVISIRWRRTYGPIAAFAGTLYSIPSLALFGVLVPITGLGFKPAFIALTSYTLLLLLRNTVEGIDGVPQSVKDAADGMGYEPWRRFTTVELRLAVPAIIAGLRVTTVTIIGLVTVGALVGSGGYGSLIKDGLQREFSTPIVVGAAFSIAMAIAFDIVFVVLERLLTPWRRTQRTDDATAFDIAPVDDVTVGVRS